MGDTPHTHHAPNTELTAHWPSAELTDSAKPQSTVAEAVECNGGTPMVEPTESEVFTEVEADVHLRPQNPLMHAHPRGQGESAASQLRDADVFQRRECVSSGSSSARGDSPPRQIHDLAASGEIGDNLRSQMQQHSSVHGNVHGHRQQ